MSGGDAVTFEGVGFSYSAGQPVLADLEFAVAAGTVTALIGLSGCGKSTVLRLAAGLLDTTEGRVLGGNQRMAFVFQRPTLLAWRTVLENVQLPLELAGSLQAPSERAMEVLQRVGLEDARDKLPGALSGGMAMRVSLARALVTQPQVLLLDEPFSALDAFTRRHLYEEVLNLQHSLKLTTLLVTHDVDEAVLFSDQVVVLRGQPASVGERLSVPLPWPRDRALLRDPRLASLATKLEEAV